MNAATPTAPPPERMLREARGVMKHAYAPFSSFAVGAAVATADGSVFTGCNVENASYGLTICAERAAVSAAVAAGHRSLVSVAVVASGDDLPYPCGACRQVLAEFADDDTPVHVAAADKVSEFSTHRLGDLIPHAFRL